MNPNPIGDEHLRCPVTMAPLKPLAQEKLKCLNRMIAAGRARHVDGTTISRVVRSALITADGRLIYRFDSRHAIMLAAKGIRADQLPNVTCRKARRSRNSLQ
jgi:hypothetical protein